MACWAGLVRRSDFWTVDILGAPLARATGGVALFLAELAAWGGRPEDRRLAKMALHSVRLGAWKIHSVAPGVLPLRVSDGWKGFSTPSIARARSWRTRSPSITPAGSRR
ncbi:MAG: hypothetical protein U0527_07100 [Candidatus Eisenbacteria bacterium]